MIESTVFTRHLRMLLLGLLLVPVAVRAQTFVIESDSRGQNSDRFQITSGSWVPSDVKSRASYLGATAVALKMESQTGAVRFNPLIKYGGDYQIEMTWPTRSNVTGAIAKVTVNGTELASVPLTMDSTNADNWFSLGLFPLTEGEGTMIDLVVPNEAKAAHDDSPMAVYADGVRFRAVQAGSLPTDAVTEENPFERATSSEPAGGASPFDSPPPSDTMGSAAVSSADSPFENPPAADNSASTFSSPPTSSSDSPFANPPAEDPFTASSSAPSAEDPFGGSGGQSLPFGDGTGGAQSEGIFGSNVEFQSSGGSEILEFQGGEGEQEGFAAPPTSGTAAASSSSGSFADPFATEAGASDPFAGSSTSTASSNDPFTGGTRASWDPFGSGGDSGASSSSGSTSMNEYGSASLPESSTGSPFGTPPSDFGGSGGFAASTPPSNTAASNIARSQDLRNFASTMESEDAEPVFVDYSASQPKAEPTPAPAGDIDWLYDLDKAMEVAREQGKPILVVFLGSNKQSETFENEVLADADAVDLINKFIPVQLDFQLDNALARKYNVPSSPYAVVLNKFGYTKSHVSMMTDTRRFNRALTRLTD